MMRQALKTRFATSSSTSFFGESINKISEIFQYSCDRSPLASILNSPTSASKREICTEAILIIFNACSLHQRLNQHNVISELGALVHIKQELLLPTLIEKWKTFLLDKYEPIINPAVLILESLTPSANTKHVLSKIAWLASSYDSTKIHDLTGHIYLQVLGRAEADGAYYTHYPAAYLLAKLALIDSRFDTEFPIKWKNLKICDLACGSGTLLLAAMQALTELPSYSTVKHDTKFLIQQIFKNNLFGLDINKRALQLAICNTTLEYPFADASSLNFLPLPHGPQEDGQVKLGSLDLLSDFKSLTQPELQMFSNSNDEIGSSLFDDVSQPLSFQDTEVIIMNPPFTNLLKRGNQYGEQLTELMRKAEVVVKNRLSQNDYEAGDVLDLTNVRSFFTPLAERLLNRFHGVLATVVPTTACTSNSGFKERLFLSKRFHIERVITSHDPHYPAFAHNTKINTSLIVCRRYNEENRNRPTQFISLAKVPKSTGAADSLVKALLYSDIDPDVLTNKKNPVFSLTSWPKEDVVQGNWSPTQWYDPDLPYLVRQIERSAYLVPVGDLFEFRPDRKGIYYFFNRSKLQTPGSIPGFHTTSTKLRKTMLGTPDVYYEVKKGQEKGAEDYINSRSHVFVAAAFDTVVGRLSSLWSITPAVGAGWLPLQIEDSKQSQSLVAWWNSTPALLMLLNQRSPFLFYPSWSLAQLRSIGVPKLDSPYWDELHVAFMTLSKTQLLPLKDSAHCEVRPILDGIAAKILDIPEDTLAEARRLLALEPFISTRQSGQHTFEMT